jgi:hypothetical protein
MKIQLFLTVILLYVLALSACGSESEPTPAANETAVPTDTISPTATQETAVTESEPVCNPTQPLNLRFGPGLSYNPPLRELSPSEDLTPLAFSAQGFPGGQWLEVEVAATGELGWVSAGSAFIACNVTPNSLPPATNIPPTPTSEPTDTPEIVAQTGPPRITNNAPGGTKAEYVKDEVIVDDEFLFRMWVADTRFGPEDGAGIDHVDFTIASLDESEIYYQNREDNAAYCVFQGGAPDCNPWLENNGRFYWPNGLEVQPGGYHATILVYPQHPEFENEVWNWDFDFQIELP